MTPLMWEDFTFKNAPPPLAVDGLNRRGFAIGQASGDEPWATDGIGSYLVMYDLDALRPVGTPIRIGVRQSGDVTSFAIDEQRKRIYDPLAGTGQVCSGSSLTVYDYGDDQLHQTTQPMPCSGEQPISVEAASFDRLDGKLYLAGTYAAEKIRQASVFGLAGLGDNDGQSLLIAQVDLAKLNSTDTATVADSLDWEIDLREYGCGRRPKLPGGSGSNDIFLGFVQRVASDVVTYCSDAQVVGIGGDQGYIVRVPLDPSTQQPKVVCRVGPISACPAVVPDPTNPGGKTVLNAEVHRIAALPGLVAPAADPVSKQILLATTDRINGNAVWAFDPTAGRFVGVVTAGNQYEAPEVVDFTTLYKTATGFDPVNGRVYVLHPGGVRPGGILVAQLRHRPLPPGATYEVVNRDTDRVDHPQIYVLPGSAGKPTRLFVGIHGVGYRVVEDTTEEAVDDAPDAVQLTDPTATEAPGKTDTTATGHSLASAAHLVWLGGPTRTLDNNDPFCSPTDSMNKNLFFAFPKNPDGSIACVADNLFAKGDREYYVASTDADVQAASAVAKAAGFAPGSGDNGTDQDLRSFPAAAGQNGQQGIAVAPDGTAGPGPDHAGYPIPGTHCEDFGTGQASASQPPSDAPVDKVASSDVTCDDAANAASAHATFSGLVLPSVQDPQVAIARLESRTTTVKLPADGQVTVSTAIANGVTVGPITIGQVASTASSKAHGRTGSATTTFQRQLCGITIAGQPGFPGCVDPDSSNGNDLVAAMNDALTKSNETAGRLWISVPPPSQAATGDGYQAVVTKPEDAQVADEEVNGDASPTVPGLQITMYNDGGQGRSRLVMQLAGVHTESRYGVIPIPDFGAPDGGTDVPAAPVVDDTSVGPAVMPAPLPAAPQTPATPAKKAAAHRAALREAARTVRTIRTKNASSVQPLHATLPAPGRPTAERLLRVPAQVLRDAAGLLINNPKQFGMLLALFSLLASPVYLGLRRRSRAVALFDHATEGTYA